MPLKIFLISLLFTIGCGKGFSPSEYTNLASEEDSDRESEGGGESTHPELSICSKLDFSQINWPTYFSTGTQNGFALALNITGSFEGHQSWNTIAGDSDKQGMSLGLLQQNFGQGTLQPLLAATKKNHTSIMKSHFTAAHWTSLTAMLDEWIKTNPVIAPPVALPGPALMSLAKRSLASEVTLPAMTSEIPIYPDDVSFSPLDSNSSEDVMFKATATAAVTKSLTWVRQNVLSGTAVKADWKKEFQAFANTPIYRNYQFIEATTLHIKTEKLRDFFGYETLTAYLFLFDVVVQNGGFADATIASYKQYVQQNPNSTEMQRLKKLLELRLLKVNPRYVADVNSRKSAILNGTGTVHGSARNLPREYCYQGQIEIDPL